jgi:hypothetical protein
MIILVKSREANRPLPSHAADLNPRGWPSIVIKQVFSPVVHESIDDSREETVQANAQQSKLRNPGYAIIGLSSSTAVAALLETRVERQLG